MSRAEVGDQALADFLFGLAIGELSKLYREGDYGFHIFKVVEQRPERPFEEVRDQLLKEFLEASPTDEEIIGLEAELRVRTPVRVRPGVLPTPAGE
jgi:parvulin-like peptidyl-prolyl isomerase